MKKKVSKIDIIAAIVLFISMFVLLIVVLSSVGCDGDTPQSPSAICVDGVTITLHAFNYQAPPELLDYAVYDTSTDGQEVWTAGFVYDIQLKSFQSNYCQSNIRIDARVSCHHNYGDPQFTDVFADGRGYITGLPGNSYENCDGWTCIRTDQDGRAQLLVGVGDLNAFFNPQSSLNRDLIIKKTDNIATYYEVELRIIKGSSGEIVSSLVSGTFGHVSYQPFYGGELAGQYVYGMYDTCLSYLGIGRSASYFSTDIKLALSPSELGHGIRDMVYASVEDLSSSLALTPPPTFPDNPYSSPLNGAEQLELDHPADPNYTMEIKYQFWGVYRFIPGYGWVWFYAEPADFAAVNYDGDPCDTPYAFDGPYLAYWILVSVPAELDRGNQSLLLRSLRNGDPNYPGQDGEEVSRMPLVMHCGDDIETGRWYCSDLMKITCMESGQSVYVLPQYHCPISMMYCPAGSYLEISWPHGDYNANGRRDLEDIDRFSECWLAELNYDPNDNPYDMGMDANFDGCVNLMDWQNGE